MRFVLAAVLAASLVPAATPVQVGYCTSIKNADAAKAAGFDYGKCRRRRSPR